MRIQCHRGRRSRRRDPRASHHPPVHAHLRICARFGTPIVPRSARPGSGPAAPPGAMGSRWRGPCARR